MSHQPHPAPIDGFSHTHAGIVAKLAPAAELPALLAAAARGRDLAAQLARLFEETILPHHADEEGDLFPAVLQSATPGEEAAQVKALVDRLEVEHHVLERQWKLLAPALRRAARGELGDIDARLLGETVRAYAAHARFEEEEFLPLAQRILSRNANHMEALGLALHLRHRPLPAGYI